jgi:hypothetical protein
MKKKMILSSHEISLVVRNRVSDIVLDGMAVEKINKSRRARNTGCKAVKWQNLPKGIKELEE